MANLVVTKTYDDGEILSEQNLDDAFQSIEAFVNITKLGTDNIQNNAVGTTQLKDSAVTAAKLGVDAVATINIQDMSVTTAKLADGSVTTNKLAAGAITPGPGSITNSMLAPTIYAISSSTGSFATSSNSAVDVGISATITSTGGRLTEIELISTDPTNLAGIYISGSTAAISGNLVYAIDGIGGIAGFNIRDTIVGFSGTAREKFSPPGGFKVYYTPNAGTTTVRVSVSAGTANTISLTNCYLIVREL